MARHRPPPIRLLIAEGNRTYADGVSEAIRDADREASAEVVTSVDEAIRQVERGDGYDGVVVGDALDDWLDVVEICATETGLIVVFVTENIHDPNAVSTAATAGVDSCLPRTQPDELSPSIVDTVAARSRMDSGDPPPSEFSGSGQPYRPVFENVTDGLVIQNPNTGRIIDVNERFCKMHGYERDEVLGESIDLVTAPDPKYSFESAADLIEQALEGEPQLFEWRNQRKDGGTFPVEVHLAVMRLHGSERVLASVREITERKRREREYEQIYNGVQGGITISDPATGSIVDVNDSMSELLGYDREEIVELGMEGITASDRGFTVDRSQELVQEVVETGEPKQFRWALETSDGETKWLDVRGTLAEIGGEDRYLLLTRDITEQRRSERRFRTISERIEEIIYLTNADLTEVYYVNSAYTNIFGRPVDELYDDAEAYFDAIIPDDREEFREVVDAMVEDIESGEPDDRYEFTYRIQRPDGEIRWLETTGYPVLNETDEPDQYVSITEDVTGQQTREQRLTVLNRILRHNVRNALDVVLAHADYIDDAEIAVPIRESATDLLTLSNKAREAEEVMRVTTGPPEPVDLTEVANAVVEQFQTGDYAGDISVECPDTLVISSHRPVIRQVLTELVENAFAHTDKDSPTVDLRVSSRPEDAAEISVADDGPGLPEREQQILYAGTETQLRHGHGIGLWFVHWAVMQLGGDLQFQENDPEGSVVTIHLYDVDSGRATTD